MISSILAPLAPLRGEGSGVRGYREEKDSNPQAKPIILGSSARIPYAYIGFPSDLPSRLGVFA